MENPRNRSSSPPSPTTKPLSLVRADTQRGRLPYEFGKFEVDLRLGQHVERIKAIHEEMNAVVFERAMAGADMPTLEHILAEIDRLEPLVEEFWLCPSQPYP